MKICEPIDWDRAQDRNRNKSASTKNGTLSPSGQRPRRDPTWLGNVRFARDWTSCVLLLTN